MIFKSILKKFRKLNKIVISYISFEIINHYMLFLLTKRGFLAQIVFLNLLTYLFI